MNFHIDLRLPPYSSEFIDELTSLSTLVFGQIESDYVAWRIQNMPKATAFISEVAGELVGYKLGYAMTQTRYYSWLGGVHPDYRQQGLASALMRKQHQWGAEAGYTMIETGTDQDNVAMAKVNLAHGFVVCGVRTKPARTQILYSKELCT